MYKDLLKQLLDKYGTTNDGLNYFLDLIGAYYLFRRNEWENDNDDEETKDRITPTLSNIRTELRLIRQLKEENNTELLEYINDQSIAYIIGIEQLFFQFNIDIWYFFTDTARRLLYIWYRAIWYYGYYQDKNKTLSDELLEYLTKIDDVKLTEQEITDNASLPVHKKTKLCYLLAKHINKANKKDELLDLIQNKDNLLNSRLLTDLTLKTDLEKMEELITRVPRYYLDTAILLESIAICLDDDINGIIKKHNEELFNEDDIKESVEHLQDYFLANDNKTDTEEEQPKEEIKEETKEEQKKPKRLTNKQLIAKYKDKTLLNGKILNANKKWAIVDTDKNNNQIMNIRETIGKKVDSNTDITKRKIRELEAKAKPSKEDLQKIKDLKTQLKEQEQEREQTLTEVEEIKADIEQINEQLKQLQDVKDIKKWNKIKKQKENLLKEKQDILKDNSLTFQLDLNGDLTYTKENKRTKEHYKLILNANYDIQNFNHYGRKFLEYIPNIPNVMEALDETYITLDLDDFIDFYGLKNPRRVRQELYKALKGMGNERYEYRFKDDNGTMVDMSLVLVGDVISVLHNNKMTLSVQLGGQYKKNIKNAIIKGNIAHVKKDVFKLGNGRNNKKEYMAQRLYLYFVKLARTEAKKGLKNGVKYEKALKVETIINHLTELNLINYNPSRYSESVKEPLQIALYTGQDLGLYEIETDAFNYYDNVISTLNNGANVKDKISTFESHLINVSLVNGDTTDLESHLKANETYRKSQAKYNKKKATKK